MPSKSIAAVTRRELLSGVAVIAAALVIDAKAGTVFDRIVMRDGWILKESDLK